MRHTHFSQVGQTPVEVTGNPTELFPADSLVLLEMLFEVAALAELSDYVAVPL